MIYAKRQENNKGGGANVCTDVGQQGAMLPRRSRVSLADSVKGARVS